MIYLEKGLKHSQLKRIEPASSDWSWLVEQQAIQAAAVNSSQEADQYKHNQGQFVIAGTMTKAIRQNANLVSRSILFFDIDNTNGDDYPAAVVKIQIAFKALAYLIYPTISNGYKGTRLRVAIPTDQPFDSEQRAHLGTYLAGLLPVDWETDLTSYRSNWSQLAGLPILNAYSLTHDDQPVSHTAPFLSLHQVLSQTKILSIKAHVSSPDRQTVLLDRQPWQEMANRTLTSLINPPSANRHLYFSSLVGSLLFMELDQPVIETLLNWSNAHSDKPLADDELKRVIVSVSRTAESKQRTNGE
ncbi:hypothetical protein ATX23_05935 [Oenococcus oeni]|uniref:hypothetical protein n=1 Tax=Oenococcus oeni TaxID=1247 RepID=UPI0008F7E96E|nr:hypothetical protein [Oenococcus oeni]OIL58942.1 hypothetical protein ATX23_05935 [Oenococcus oeni]